MRIPAEGQLAEEFEKWSLINQRAHEYIKEAIHGRGYLSLESCQHTVDFAYDLARLSIQKAQEIKPIIP